MKIALVRGNRFTPWHFEVYRRIPGAPEFTAFRADSEIQRYYHEQGERELDFAIAPIGWDTEEGGLLERWKNRSAQRLLRRPPRVRPFSERLQGFDVIQTWELSDDWSAEAARASRRYNIPLCTMVWDNIPFNHEVNARQVENKRVVLEATRLFVVHTRQSEAMLLLEGVEAERIRRVEVGVDTGVFSPGISARAQWGLDPEAFVVLFVGWFLPRKGLQVLLHALHLVRQQGLAGGRKIQLAVAGTGPGRREIEALARRLGLNEQVQLLGALPYRQMPELYRSADLFVLPSVAMPDWQEQFGMALIEAMACGVPCIASDSGAIPEIAGERGAMLTTPGNAERLAAAIGTLMTSPATAEALATAGRARALEEFGIERFAKRLAGIYDELLAKPSPA